MKINKKPEGGGNWMDTYGDMVTLLLCFFVLLYSISNVDKEKWDNLVKSMNPNAAEVSQLVTDTDIKPGNNDVQGGLKPDTEIQQEPTEAQKQAMINEEQFKQAVERVEQMVQDMGIQENVEITTGEGYSFISFRDEVFFDGDSEVLKPQGQVILDAFCGAIAPSAGAIKELQVLGHTSQADPNIPNEIITDRTLSAARSAQVVAYIQIHNIIEPSKLVSAAYGQHRPIDTFETKEGRAKNRRAEILITKTGSVEKNLEEYYKQAYGDTGQPKQ